MTEIKNFQEFVFALTHYWTNLGCIWSQPYDSQMGAGTFHPHTFLKGIGPEPWYAVYVQPCRRPVDGRYGKSTYRFQHYYQLQVLLKPAPTNIVDIFLRSLEAVGIKLVDNDIALLEDDWKGPTLGAWGLGWEVRANGQEVTQFTYFQQLGGLDVDVVSGEITYGLERLYMYAKGMKSALDIPYNDSFTYGDIFVQNEYEFSFFNFKDANVKELFAYFELCEKNVFELCAKNLVLPAYDYVLQASHTFNLLDARGVISVSERQRYIGRVRDCAKQCAQLYRETREKLGFPMMSRAQMSVENTSATKTYQEVKETELDCLKKGKDKINISDVGKQNAAEKHPPLIIELGVEEMPPSFQSEASDFLNKKTDEWIKDLKSKFVFDKNFVKALEASSFQSFISSRRIALKIENLPGFEPNQEIEIWGPAERIAKNPDGTLTQAGEGFCKKNSIPIEQIEFKNKGESKFLYAKKHVSGEKLAQKFCELFLDWIEQIPAALKMKWQNDPNSKTFIRPVRWLLALNGDEVLKVSAFELNADRITFGQRILSPQPMTLHHASEYESALREAHVEVEREKRRQKILEASAVLLKPFSGNVVDDKGLLEKCIGLTESPNIFVGEFDKKYLELPRKLIVSVLREHMNYFAVENKAGDILPFYVGVANYACRDTQNMVRGTQDVVIGRLDDGEFYYRNDLETPIGEFRERLKSQLFQAGMGTLFEKSERIESIAEACCKSLSSIPAMRARPDILEIVKEAAKFCKADLKTGCVQEFPDEMQGEMGGILVKTQKIFGQKTDDIAIAIQEHYLPAGASQQLPSTLQGRIVSLADKLDSLLMLINSGADVKGNKDPFGLRRIAIGILRICGLNGNDENVLPFGIEQLVALGLKCLQQAKVKVSDNTFEKACSFLKGRMRAGWRDELDSRAIDAVCDGKNELSVVQSKEFVWAITNALTLTGENSLLSALLPYKRCRNVTLPFEKIRTQFNEIDVKLFRHAHENTLWEEVLRVSKEKELLLKNSDFEKLILVLTEIGKPLAAFFENVMVNDKDENLKKNRLAILFKIRDIYEDVADFSKIQAD